MSLGKPRRRPDGPSSPDSLRDALYDRLLASLRWGDEPLATEEECSRFVREWAPTHPGVSFPLLDGSLHRPMERRQALDILHAIPEGAYVEMRQAMHEDTRPAPDPFLEPLEVEPLRAEWRRGARG